ncbi:amidohydrolase family protein [Priestia taiwanensis]|uniref:Xaa-Pro dipeptidase n=1 Tax=Priestia taiwanensis TaxID=1347902 RepID=A0A917EL31_9BACI|nr:amidohydrolase family protein [Priestia taiwanensis]MBM7362045.1 cytosine/adenosine deaminase-related metal-dependent hydrolase [Priestia taiwanensis]GGE59018.1 Xaa-Pro dipeptidase [Priestia taiwanensis]
MIDQTLIQNGNIINVETGDIYTASLLIEDGYIRTIYQNEEEFPLHNDIRVVNASGKWIIPGLIDMHVHIRDAFAPCFIASGVTAVRDMAGSLIMSKQLLEAPVEAPTPRLFAAERMIDGLPGMWGDTSPFNLNTDDPEVAREEVRRQIEAGAKYVKLYCLVSQEVMEAVVDEAKKYGIEVSCDLIHATEVNALDAAKAGVVWNEHASGCIRVMYPNWSMAEEESVWQEIDWENPDKEKIEMLCRELKKYNVKLCPTMMLHDQMRYLPEYWCPDNVVMEKIKGNKDLMGQWEQLAGCIEAFKKSGIQTKMIQTIAKTYFDIGGTVVTGTDTPAGPWVWPGMGLHRELELFVDAGFSELDALRAATITAADAMNQHELGRIQEGCAADLVLLNNNPLENIEDTKDIHVVMKGGAVYTQNEALLHIPSKEELERLKKEFMELLEAEIC